MIYGYARISTKKQSIERQVRNIRERYPEAVILQEEWTGTSMTRPVWSRLMGQLRDGDTVVFDSVSRMSRSAEEGFAVYRDLMERGVELVYLKEPYVDTAVYKRAQGDAVPMTGTEVDIILQAINSYLLRVAETQIRLAFEQAEKEVADLHQRTREGMITAKLSGKRIGRAEGESVETKKSKETKRMIKRYSRDFDGNLTDREVMMIVKVSKNSYYKYKRELLIGG